MTKIQSINSNQLYISQNAEVSLKLAGNTAQVTFTAGKNKKCSIKNISKDEFVDLSTGEVKKRRHSENRFQSPKAMIFNDNEVADLILSTSNVGKIKSLGRSVSNYNDLIWNGMRQIVVYKGLVGKFSQSDELLKRLINTGDDILAECSVQDVVWGIGLSMSDPNVNDLSKWCGQNLLGFTLMLVRKE